MKKQIEKTYNNNTIKVISEPNYFNITIPKHD